jgi:hypothetical protein
VKETAAAEPGKRSGQPKEDFTTAGLRHPEPSTQMPDIPRWLPQALPFPGQEEVSQDFISNTPYQSGIQQSSSNEGVQPGISEGSEANSFGHIQLNQTLSTSWAQDISTQQQQAYFQNYFGNSFLPPSHHQDSPNFPTQGTVGGIAGQPFPCLQGQFASGAPGIQYTLSYAPQLAADPSQQQEQEQQQQQMAPLVALQLLSVQSYQMAQSASSAIAAAAGAVLSAGIAAGHFTGRPPVLLAMACDKESLSPYQCLLRQQIQFFEAQYIDVESNAQGRNKRIVLGQVGIQCRFCCLLPPKQCARGAVYYPTQLQGIYQAAQNMGTIHLCEHCNRLPSALRETLAVLRSRRSSAGGGKDYWAESARAIGVYETRNEGLRFLSVSTGLNQFPQEESRNSVKN